MLSFSCIGFHAPCSQPACPLWLALSGLHRERFLGSHSLMLKDQLKQLKSVTYHLGFIAQWRDWDEDIAPIRMATWQDSIS